MLFFAIISLCIWVYLFFFRGSFWITDLNEASPQTKLEAWPEVAVLIPARNEAAVIRSTLSHLFAQDYLGKWCIYLIDDHSDDATQTVALETADALGKRDQLTILQAEDLPEKWSGKVWALQNGFEHLQRSNAPAEFLLLMDADIDHGPSVLTQLVEKAVSEQLHLVSCMVKLQCKIPAEQFMIPAFIYFFKMLYPFRWINQPKNHTAGAAGGTMLIRKQTLHELNGFHCIQNALIDDCSLGKALKAKGPIWLTLTNDSTSSRSYAGLGEIWMMIARTAYTQLNYAPLNLLGCIVGMSLTYILPVYLTLFGEGLTASLATITWILMSITYYPTLKFYQQSVCWAPMLPIVAFVYMGATLDSARRYYLGNGGYWKGRAQA